MDLDDKGRIDSINDLPAEDGGGLLRVDDHIIDGDLEALDDNVAKWDAYEKGKKGGGHWKVYQG